ncbi:hypothetical protein AV530_010296 [Patagioenas fasciata monilis]|uniref:Uncharacterized protein n=1 Tax=Patagioenas fasciata monilis TaxID=372326 RepID=A0A1V4KPZ7_PATFA|nr:hypothetical protein AV530_010296 [Patagioenas fasciata monilis]
MRRLSWTEDWMEVYRCPRDSFVDRSPEKARRAGQNKSLQEIIRSLQTVLRRRNDLTTLEVIRKVRRLLPPEKTHLYP